MDIDDNKLYAEISCDPAKTKNTKAALKPFFTIQSQDYAKNEPAEVND